MEKQQMLSANRISHEISAFQKLQTNFPRCNNLTVYILILILLNCKEVFLIMTGISP